MKSFLSMLASFMNDAWYEECRTPERESGQNDQFAAMLACFMNDERYLHYR